MPSYAHVTLVGHVGRDPEMRYTPTGLAVVTFSLGVTIGYGDRRSTLWADVRCFGKLAERVNESVRKGQPLLISGEPGSLEYEVEGEKRYRKSLPVTASEVRFLTAREVQPEIADDEPFRK